MIYIASKTVHAPHWIKLRDVYGVPINSSWIDEAGEGQTESFADLWERIEWEVKHAKLFVLYREANEPMKGALVELGIALGCFPSPQIHAFGHFPKNDRYTVLEHDAITVYHGTNLDNVKSWLLHNTGEEEDG